MTRQAALEEELRCWGDLADEFGMDRENAYRDIRRILQQRCDLQGADADPGFGVDPEDSAALLELQQTIDDLFGWRTDAEEEAGDYAQRLQQVASYLGATETSYRRFIRT